MKPTIEYSDFEKLDIRIGKVITASEPDWSKKLLQLTVDFGEEIGEKNILSGIKEWYSPDDFVGNTYMFVINLAERKMGEGVSQGMMIMADGDDKPVPFALKPEVDAGTVVR
jgi:methionine--tRNA ligase beta chain